MTEEKKKAVEERVFGREEFMGLENPKPEKIYIDSLKGYVYVSHMSGEDLEEFEGLLMEVIEKPNGEVEIEQRREGMREKWLVICLRDAEGKRLFKSSEYKLLQQKPAEVLKELYEKTQDVNKVTKEALEKMRKNSLAKDQPV